LKKSHFVQTILEPSLKWLKEEELVQRPTLSHEETAMTPLRLNHTQRLSDTTVAQHLSEHFAMSMVSFSREVRVVVCFPLAVKSQPETPIPDKKGPCPESLSALVWLHIPGFG
jgi:hypothetical protein